MLDEYEYKTTLTLKDGELFFLDRIVKEVTALEVDGGDIDINIVYIANCHKYGITFTCKTKALNDLLLLSVHKISEEIVHYTQRDNYVCR